MNTKIAVIGFSVADVALIAASVFLYMNLDRNAPVITFAENESQLVYSENMSEEDLLEGVSATDDVDGDLTDAILIEKISETSDENVIVTYVVLDSSDNVAKKSRIYGKE